MSRPLKIVDEKRIIELASKGYSFKQIAALEDISYATLHRRFESACEKGREICNGNLLQKQYERAMAGSDTMLIWLGKQRLGQADKSETTATVKHEITDLSHLSDEQLAEVQAIIESANVSASSE